jgi:hypothetical protein
MDEEAAAILANCRMSIKSILARRIDLCYLANLRVSCHSEILRTKYCVPKSDALVVRRKLDKTMSKLPQLAIPGLSYLKNSRARRIYDCFIEAMV